MSKLSNRKAVSILQILQEHDKPLGSALIALKLHKFGIDMSERTVRYYLKQMDHDGLTKNFAKKGRMITGLCQGIGEYFALMALMSSDQLLCLKR